MSPEEAKELQQTMLWGKFVKVLEADIEALKENMVSIRDPERLGRLQEAITTLRSVIKRPENLVEKEA